MDDAAIAPCSANPEQASYSVGMARMMGLETAADMLGGKRHLGDVLGMGERAAAHKVAGTRGVSNGDLLMAAGALDKLASRIAAHAQKLRAEAAPR